MIGIDMELPKGCASCKICCCKGYNDLVTYEEPDEWEYKRLPDCPLVDLGKEDMSWEELVEKVKELKSELLSIRNDCIVCVSFLGAWDCLEFGIDNQIVFKYLAEEKTINTDRSFYQMYQIIKSLVGDER